MELFGLIKEGEKRIQDFSWGAGVLKPFLVEAVPPLHALTILFHSGDQDCIREQNLKNFTVSLDKTLHLRCLQYQLQFP